ncbi:MAG: hypothetical protein Q4E16_06150 [Neisseria sp.]|nr:hypothetical protein [Neisseria sp.]
MSKELSWADLMNGDFQAPEQPKYYLQEELFENPEAIITRFMDGLKNYLEKDIQKEICTYQISYSSGSFSALFDISLPNTSQNLILKYNLQFFLDGLIAISFLQTIPNFCDNNVKIDPNDMRFINVPIEGFVLLTTIDDPAYEQYLQETNWEEIYIVIQQRILQHPALKR